MSALAGLRYTAIFLAVAVGVGVLVAALNTHAETALGSSAQLMVPAMIAAAVEGRQYARRHRRMPKGAAAWNITWGATAIATALNVVLAWFGGALLPEFTRLAIAPPASKQFLILLGLYAGGYLICNRLFLGIGAGNQLALMRSRGEIE